MSSNLLGYPRATQLIHAEFETSLAVTLILKRASAEFGTLLPGKGADIETRLGVIHAESGTTSYREFSFLSLLR
jgi:hypothetical protein